VAFHIYKTAENDARVTSIRDEITSLQQPIDQFSQVQQQVKDVESTLATRSTELSDLQSQLVRYQGQVGIHRSRMPALLKAISELSPTDLALLRIETKSDEIRLLGRSVRSESISRFASSLSVRLAPLNLSLSVPRREALLRTANGGPYEFEFVLKDGV
ncbi:MAG: hypothetical protein AAFP90_06810, partial [Planctomycetota bacterium]